MLNSLLWVVKSVCLLLWEIDIELIKLFIFFVYGIVYWCILVMLMFSLVFFWVFGLKW